ncbi:hypothetical protein OIU34_22010 [Pararhizobium sp. BT-229]|uniref:hypothetical protein n=1 Tax=Pararhizobium sp. BT-229 TaxID=2986923 RepID=UPI0021F7BF4B|nr:hypothetical protein [Pararhizobium sp. BT-229]MCV9964568.1 hypothetical protein [Pararhizobium sp. BT-229]
MQAAANDNETHGYAPPSFRDKVFLFYRDTKVLPGSADLLATHYVSALRRRETFDPDCGPIMPGCDAFGPEPSPREIVAAHVRNHPESKKWCFPEVVEAGIAAARHEMLTPACDVFGGRYKRVSYRY